MSSQVVLGGEKGRREAGHRADVRLDRSGGAGTVLVLVSVALVVLGGLDIVLTWYPMQLGNVEWEFGTITASLNGMPSVTFGLGLWLATALVLERARTAFTLSAVSWLLALLIAASGLLYARTVPIAISSVSGAVQMGIYKAIAKTTAQCIIYPLVFAAAGFVGIRTARRFVRS